MDWISDGDNSSDVVDFVGNDGASGMEVCVVAVFDCRMIIRYIYFIITRLSLQSFHILILYTPSSPVEHSLTILRLHTKLRKTVLH